jgi:hypothetical protein
MTLPEIDVLTRDYAAARSDLSELVADLNFEVEAAKRRRLVRLRNLVGIAAEKQNTLTAALEESKHLFERPRTLVLHGIKVGWAKAKGGLEIDDPERTVELILMHYSRADAEALLHITRRPDKDAIAKLSVGELRKLAVEVTEDGDRVVIKPTDSEVDKIVTALLKDATEEATEG